MFSTLPTSPVMQQRWRTAPIISEWCGTPTTSTTLGARQVKKCHISMTSSGNLALPHEQMGAEQRAGFLDAARSSGYRYGVRRVTVPRRVEHAHRFTVVSRWDKTGSAPT